MFSLRGRTVLELGSRSFSANPVEVLARKLRFEDGDQNTVDARSSRLSNASSLPAMISPSLVTALSLPMRGNYLINQRLAMKDNETVVTKCLNRVRFLGSKVVGN
jgi:hypothetical protein